MSSDKRVAADGSDVQLLEEMEHTMTVSARGESLQDLTGKLF